MLTLAQTPLGQTCIEAAFERALAAPLPTAEDYLQTPGPTDGSTLAGHQG